MEKQYKRLEADLENMPAQGGFLTAVFRGECAWTVCYGGLTARLVDALVSGGNAVMYAIWALACTALTALLGCILKHWKSAEAEQYEVNFYKAVADKFMDMDFADADSQRIYDLNSRIFQSRNFSGRGLDEALRILDELPANALKIIGGAALSASLFASWCPRRAFAAGQPVVCSGNACAYAACSPCRI